MFFLDTCNVVAARNQIENQNFRKQVYPAAIFGFWIEFERCDVTTSIFCHQYSSIKVVVNILVFDLRDHCTYQKKNITFFIRNEYFMIK